MTKCGKSAALWPFCRFTRGASVCPYMLLLACIYGPSGALLARSALFGLVEVLLAQALVVHRELNDLTAGAKQKDAPRDLYFGTGI